MGVNPSQPSVVHLVEGKLLNIPTHGFEETRSQLDTWRPYADRLWCVFPKDAWMKASTNHARWHAELTERGYGLLLASGSDVQQLIVARPNGSVDPHKRRDLELAVRGNEHERVELPLLSARDAASAVQIVTRCLEIVDGLKLLFKKQQRPDEPHWDSRPIPWLLFVGFRVGDVSVEPDPFGSYLQDGVPVIAVWRNFDNGNDLKRCIATIESVTEALVYQERDDGMWECAPLNEWTRSYRTDDNRCAVGRLIRIGGRSIESVRADCDALVKWAKALK